MILGSAKDSLRDRADSISAFKKYEKVGGFNEGSKPFCSPDLSPALLASNQFNGMAGWNPLAKFGGLTVSQQMMAQPQTNNLQSILMQQLGAG